MVHPWFKNVIFTGPSYDHGNAVLNTAAQLWFEAKMTTTTKARATLKGKKVRNAGKLTAQVLAADRRLISFTSKAVVTPTPADIEEGFVAVVCNSRGEPLRTTDGELFIVPCIPMGIEVVANPDKLLSWKQMADRAGMSLSQAKRLSADGKLPRPEKLGKRKVGFRQGAVDAAVAKLKP